MQRIHRREEGVIGISGFMRTLRRIVVAKDRRAADTGKQTHPPGGRC
jgi:hypothetical protein